MAAQLQHGYVPRSCVKTRGYCFHMFLNSKPRSNQLPQRFGSLVAPCGTQGVSRGPCPMWPDTFHVAFEPRPPREQGSKDIWLRSKLAIACQVPCHPFRLPASKGRMATADLGNQPPWVTHT